MVVTKTRNAEHIHHGVFQRWQRDKSYMKGTQTTDTNKFYQ